MTLVAAASFAGVPLLLGVSAEGKPVRPSLTGRVPPGGWYARNRESQEKADQNRSEVSCRLGGHDDRRKGGRQRSQRCLPSNEAKQGVVDWISRVVSLR